MSNRLRRLVSFTGPELTLLLDSLDHYASTDPRTKRQTRLLGDIREKIVLTRYGKIRKSEMPAIREGRRTPVP